MQMLTTQTGAVVSYHPSYLDATTIHAFLSADYPALSLSQANEVAASSRLNGCAANRASLRFERSFAAARVIYLVNDEAILAFDRAQLIAPLGLLLESLLAYTFLICESHSFTDSSFGIRPPLSDSVFVQRISAELSRDNTKWLPLFDTLPSLTATLKQHFQGDNHEYPT